MKSDVAQQLFTLLKKRVEAHGAFRWAANIISGLQTGNDHFIREAYEVIIEQVLKELAEEQADNETLREIGQDIVDNWKSGDLAACVGRMDNYLNNNEEEEKDA